MNTLAANLPISTAPTVYFNWADDLKHVLAKYVHRNQAYKKTSQSFKEKYEIVLFQLKQKPQFASLNISWNGIQVSFKRDQAAVLTKFGILKEQVNLSGLNEEPTEYEKLHLDMAEEDYKESTKRKSKTLKVKAQKRLNNVIATEGLRQQGVVGDSNAENQFATPNSSSGESSVSTTTNVSHTFNSFAYLENMMKPLIQVANINDDDAELDRELKRQKLKTLKAEEEYWLKKTSEMI